MFAPGEHHARGGESRATDCNPKHSWGLFPSSSPAGRVLGWAVSAKGYGKWMVKGRVKAIRGTKV